MTHEDELRAWAKGSYPYTAATELLLRAFDGKFARPGNVWIVEEKDDERVWINFEAIPDNVGGLSGGERRLLMLVASLADVGVGVELGDLLPGLDRKILDLLLAAVAHAGGSHEHSDVVANAEGKQTIKRLPSLYPWPEED